MEKGTETEKEAEQLHHRRRGDSHAAELDQRDLEPHWQQRQRQHSRQRRAVAKGDAGQLEPVQLVQLEEIGNQSSSAAVALQRVKRKSGKTTGALSRPKGGGDSSSKTTSRKDKGKDIYSSICIAARHWQCHSAHDKNLFVLHFKAAVAVSLSVCPSVLCLHTHSHTHTHKDTQHTDTPGVLRVEYTAIHSYITCYIL